MNGVNKTNSKRNIEASEVKDPPTKKKKEKNKITNDTEQSKIKDEKTIKRNDATKDSDTIICKVCCSGEEGEKMLLCDNCDDGYHIYCLDPPLLKVPRGKWYCKTCEARPGYEPWYNDEEQSCCACGKSGQWLLKCTECTKYYHRECTACPLLKLGIDWTCDTCTANALNGEQPAYNTRRAKRSMTNQPEGSPNSKYPKKDDASSDSTTKKKNNAKKPKKLKKDNKSIKTKKSKNTSESKYVDDISEENPSLEDDLDLDDEPDYNEDSDTDNDVDKPVKLDFKIESELRRSTRKKSKIIKKNIKKTLKIVILN